MWVSLQENDKELNLIQKDTNNSFLKPILIILILMALLLFELFFRHQLFIYFDSIFGIHIGKTMSESDSLEAAFDIVFSVLWVAVCVGGIIYYSVHLFLNVKKTKEN